MFSPVCSITVTQLMNPFWRERTCPFHHPEKVIFICGPCKFVCDACRAIGWVSTAGTGGGDFLYNSDLNLEIVKGKLLAYDRDVQEEDDDSEDEDDPAAPLF